MTLIRRAILALALLAGIAPAIAAPPPPVPALPDTERRVTYGPLNPGVCNCALGFAIYGDGTDYQNWVQVYVNGVLAPYNDPAVGWTLSSPSGAFNLIPRPVTDAVLSFNLPVTGTIQIVGARRPRRVAQFNETRGVPARDLNQVLSDITAVQREVWDRTGRSVMAPPGETLNLLAAAGTRSNQLLGFDTLGQVALYSPVSALLTASVPAVAIESFSGGCGVTDSTTALLAAAGSIAGAVRVTLPNNCTYNFRQANVINFTKPVLIQGTAPGSTILNFAPSTDGTFLNWSNGLSVLYAAGGAGIDNVTITSSDTTHAKKLVSFSDVSGFRATNSSIGWPYGGITGGTGGSTCIYSHGRETAKLGDLALQCDKPIQLGMNPHHYLATDHFHSSNLYLLPSSGYAPVTVDPGVVLTSTTFDGYQAWAGGGMGFDWNDTSATHYVFAVPSGGSGYTVGVPVTLAGGTCSTPITVTPLRVNGSGAIIPLADGSPGAAVANPGVCSVIPSNPVSAASGGATFTIGYVASYQLAFHNVRSEQGPSPTAYTFNIRPAGALQELLISDSAMDSARCGTFLKNVLFATIQSSVYQGGGSCNKAVDATAANGNESIRYTNDFWLTGVTHNVTGMTRMQASDSPTGTSTTVPPSALYSQSAVSENFNNVAANTFNNVAITKPASTATITPGSGKTFTFNSTMTQNATDGAVVNFGGGGTVVYTGGGAALTKADDANVTLALGGSPSIALLNPASITVGWSGFLSAARGGFGIDVSAQGGIPIFSSGVPTFTPTNGTGNPVRTTSAALITPSLGVATAASINGNAFTTGTGTLTLGAGKTLTASSTLTLAGTDGTIMTFPSTSATIARTDTSQTFTNNQTFSATIIGSINGNAATATNATNTTNSNITDDTTTNAAMYPTVASANTGNVGLKTTSTKLTFNPSTGVLSATSFTGAGTGLTGTAASLTSGDVANAPVIAKVLTGYVSGPGTVSAADSILSALQKINGNDALKAPLASPALTGTPTAPTAAVDTSTTQLATTAMVLGQAASATPLIDGAAAVGTSTRYARADHVHPTDNTKVATVKRQSFCASGCTTTIAAGGSGTYTPSTGMLYSILECKAAGGGAGSVAGTVLQVYAGSGGGEGGYSKSVVTAATVGASKTVFIGDGGAGGASGSNNGAAGADACFTSTTCSSGQIVAAKGGTGGQFASAAQIPAVAAGGVTGTGDWTMQGAPGGGGAYSTTNNAFFMTNSGGGQGGAVAPTPSSGAAVAGNAAAANSGGGGSGATSNAAANAAGGKGGSAICFATEYNSQ